MQRNSTIAQRLIVFACAALLMAGLALADGETAAEQTEEFKDRIALCTTCHGEAGMPEDPEVPIIWGQHFYYLYVQLKDYKAGRRTSEIMQGIVEEFSRADMKALAQHFSEKKWPATQFRADETAVTGGETAAAAGQCPQCHLGGYEGDSRVPRLKGQTPTYLLKTMQAFKQKTRKNSPAKSSLLESYSDRDIDNMAKYLGDL